MHDAVLYEMLMHKHAELKEWPAAIAAFVGRWRSHWPVATLGEPEQEPKTFTVAEKPLLVKIERMNARYHRNINPLRNAAIIILEQSGQLYLPPANMRLADYFKPQQNIVCNQGWLGPPPVPKAVSTPCTQHPTPQHPDKKSTATGSTKPFMSPGARTTPAPTWPQAAPEARRAERRA